MEEKAQREGESRDQRLSVARQRFATQCSPVPSNVADQEAYIDAFVAVASCDCDLVKWLHSIHVDLPWGSALFAQACTQATRAWDRFKRGVLETGIMRRILLKKLDREEEPRAMLLIEEWPCSTLDVEVFLHAYAEAYQCEHLTLLEWCEKRDCWNSATLNTIVKQVGRTIRFKDVQIIEGNDGEYMYSPWKEMARHILARADNPPLPGTLLPLPPPEDDEAMPPLEDCQEPTSKGVSQ